VDLAHYQQQTRLTDQRAGGDRDPRLVPLLGLAGEAGTLLAEYKKHLRDGEAHGGFLQRIADDLGDVLWYAAATATHFGLSLDTIAHDNLAKTRRRWLHPTSGAVPAAGLFDERRPAEEQLPRRFTVRFTARGDRWAPTARMELDGRPVGDPLSDKAYGELGYRWHDVFHLAYAACLSWSPTFRTLIGRRRVSDPVVNGVEDGGRAKVIDEGIAALVFDYARRHAFLDGVTAVDDGLLAMITSLTAGLEVHARTPAEWEHAILSGFTAFRLLRRNDGGIVIGDLHARTLTYAPHQAQDVPAVTAAAR